MLRRLTTVVILGLMLSLAAHAGVVIDRVVVTVNNHPILQSDWEDAVRFEAFLQRRAVAAISENERREALDRLIDQEILRQQMQADFSPPPEQISKRVAEVKSQIPGAKSEQGWRAALAEFGLSEALLREKLLMQLQVMTFVDLRLRPAVRVDRETVASYYTEKLLPELKSKGVPEPALAKVSPQIRELLTQQRIDELLTTWLANLRNQSAIHLAEGLATKRVAQNSHGAK